MRLCYVANASNPHTGKWVNHFCSKGSEVHLVSFEEPRGIAGGVFVHKLRTRWASSLRYFTVADQLRRIIKEIRPDLLHAHYAAGYGTLARLARFHPYVLSVWGSDVFEVPAKSPLHRALIKKNLVSADRVCSTSQFMADHTRQYYDGPIDLTPFGVDCDKFKPSTNGTSDQEEIVIGTVKSLDEKYGINYLIESFALLVEKYRGPQKLRLVIAGEGVLKEELQGLAKKLGVGEVTEFLGFVSNSEVPKLLHSFSVFVAVSVLDSETFGVAVVEASACGLPVVVSDVGGLRETVRNGITGFMVRRRDAGATAEAIGALVNNETLRREFGAAGRRLVQDNYEWSENASRMERLYETLVQPGNRVNPGEVDSYARTTRRMSSE
jgi:glycosyltransferase involved in cell wall biosynthesis